jgi:hypothetical protein
MAPHPNPLPQGARESENLSKPVFCIVVFYEKLIPYYLSRFFPSPFTIHFSVFFQKYFRNHGNLLPLLFTKNPYVGILG